MRCRALRLVELAAATLESAYSPYHASIVIDSFKKILAFLFAFGVVRTSMNETMAT